jgi:acetolactate synthase-1/2/3 large subunit
LAHDLPASSLIGLDQHTAAQALVAQLRAYGVEHVFCVPGESYLAVLDALIDSGVTVTVCRQEGGVAMMADAVGRFTGKPGVAMVTRAPGATNASVGVHIAQQDSTPMILFAGQVERRFKGREAWQETDYGALFGGLTKWTAEPSDANRLTETVARAFHIATAGRNGPVVIGLPKDLVAEKIAPRPIPAFSPVVTAPSNDQIDAVMARLAKARRPLAILGGSGWTAEAREAYTRFAERYSLPTATSYRRMTLFDPLHRLYAGDVGLGANPKLINRVKDADLVLLLGGRMGEVASQGFTLFPIGVKDERLIHVFPEAEELGRLYPPGLGLCATPSAFVEALDQLPAPAAPPVWTDQAPADHQLYLDWSEAPTEQPGPVNLSKIMIWLREHLPPQTILCNGAGSYASWIHRFYRFRQFGAHMAPTSATMGYGVPAAVAMKRLFPDRPVIAVAGDGDFLMNGQEFATAAQYDLPIICIVLDNASYGSIRLSQEQAYPGRTSATDLKNPDFAAYARAFGGFGATVERTEDFAAAFEACEASGLPSIIHVKYDQDGITPTLTLSGVRAKAGVR